MAEYISNSKTTKDWEEDRQKLIVGGNTGIWEQVFGTDFKSRRSSRYLKPINAIRKDGFLQGEGFSIVAIQCSLIEFLQSTVQGLSYKYLEKGGRLGAFEYSSSSGVFKTFLTSHQPFAGQFISPDIARDFYVNVRCALLHEARTKGGWRIHADDPMGQKRVIDSVNKIVYRNDFQAALLAFINDYGMQLQANIDYQEAFIRKFNSLIK